MIIKQGELSVNTSWTTRQPILDLIQYLGNYRDITGITDITVMAKLQPAKLHGRVFCRLSPLRVCMLASDSAWPGNEQF